MRRRLRPAPLRENSDDSLFRKKLSKDDQILHALDRLTFGPRPGDVEAIRKMGLRKWMELQLHPERIPESKVLEEKLAPLDSLQLSAAEVVATYPPPQLVRSVVLGRQNPPDNPLARAAIEKMAGRLKITKDDALDAPLEPVRPLEELLTPQQIGTLRNGTPDERRQVLATIPEDRIEQVIGAMLPCSAGSSPCEPVRQPACSPRGVSRRRDSLLTAGPLPARLGLAAREVRGCGKPRQPIEIAGR